MTPMKTKARKSSAPPQEFNCDLPLDWVLSWEALGCSANPKKWTPAAIDLLGFTAGQAAEYAACFSCSMSDGVRRLVLSTDFGYIGKSSYYATLADAAKKLAAEND